jgi:hypothetical protein
MSEQSEVFVATTPSSTAERNDPLAGVRQLAYAWIGLWGVAAEVFSNFYQRCAARGEQILQAKPSSPRPELNPSAPDAAATELRKPTPKVIRPMSVFNAFGAVESYHIDLNAEGLLPTKQEFDTLSERVEVLAREVDALVKQREQVA